MARIKISKKKIENLYEISRQARKLMVHALVQAGCGHPGGAFSSVDIMIGLYFAVMKLDCNNPHWEERDRFILSKGHSSVAFYSVLSLAGFLCHESLMTFRQDGSLLSGHPDMHKVPGVEASTGSLGHGLSIGAGLALSGKMDRKKYRVFVLMGDGETQEGSVWEAAMFSRHYKLDNLVGIIDRNKLQIDGSTEKIMALEPYRAKWKSFGWEVKVIDGHNMRQIVNVFKNIPFRKGAPSLVIANTVKGKGISFMEDKPEWHGRPLKGRYADIARQEIECF